MTNLKSILTLILLGFCTISMSAKINLPADGEIKIPVELINGLVIFKASIDGAERNFILDTGADNVLIDDAEYKASPSKVSFETLNQSVQSSKVNLEFFSIGNISQTNIEAYTTNLEAIENYLGIDITGIIGFGFFFPNNLIVDFQNNLLIINAKSSFEIPGARNARFQMIKGIPCIDMNIGKKSYKFALDSGASTHMIDKKLVRSNRKKFTKLSSKVSIVSASGKGKSLKKVSSSNLSINHHNLGSLNFVVDDFSKIREALGTPIHGILSLSSLSDKKVIINTANSKIYF